MENVPCLQGCGFPVRKALPCREVGGGVLVVRDARRSGAENMRIDEALLARGEPVVRLYGWDPACVSLGYTQNPDAVDEQAVDAFGLDVVERPTGGGAILHMPSEVTYCVVVPTSWEGLPGDLFEDYRYLSQGVLDALDSWGVEASFREAKGGKDAFCYLREAGVSIVDGDGRKISGGAQRRTKDAVLQHGTVLVEMDSRVQADLFGVPEEQVRSGVGSLARLGVDVDRSVVVQRLAGAFVEALGAGEVRDVGPDALDALGRARSRHP